MTDYPVQPYDSSPEAQRGRDAIKFLADLDRCPHGRHEGDTCSGWQPGGDDYHRGCRGGWSLGNPYLKTGQVAGYGLGAKPYVMPPRGERHKLSAWTDHDHPHCWRPER